MTINAPIDSPTISEAEAADRLGVDPKRLSDWRRRAMAHREYHGDDFDLPYAFDAPGALAPPFVVGDGDAAHYLESEIVPWREFWVVPPAEVSGWSK